MDSEMFTSQTPRMCVLGELTLDIGVWDFFHGKPTFLFINFKGSYEVSKSNFSILLVVTSECRGSAEDTVFTDVWSAPPQPL